jgi:membrane protein DedA with SNARE-associated domain
MMTTGSLASFQNRSLLALFILALCGALGKLLGALLVYYFSDKIEDIFTGKWGKFFGINHARLESIGKRLGNNWKDYVILTGLRALPILPSSIVSISCGLLKVKLKLFIVSTFLGTIVRDAIYIYIGYAGVQAAVSLVNQSSTIESLIQIIVVAALIIGLIIAYIKRKKSMQHLDY